MQTTRQILSAEYFGTSAGGEEHSASGESARQLKRSPEREGGWRSRLAATRWGLVLLIGFAFLAIYFWQIFVTMPHLMFADGDTGSYLNKLPQRTVAVYYFVKSVLLLWRDLYAVAAAQGVLLALFAVSLAYALGRLTRSAVLSLAPLLVCLFNVNLLEPSGVLSSDGLFPIACIGLMASALLLYEKVSPRRVGCFLLFGFFVCFIRSIGEPLLWSLIVVLALLLWPQHRRMAGVLVAGALGIHALITGISYLNYRIWVPQAQAGIVLINEAAFIADEQPPPGSGGAYPREFVAATAPIRAEYKKAAGWAQKYRVMDAHIGAQIWKLGLDTLVRGGTYDFDRRRYDKFKRYGNYAVDVIMMNDVFQHAALTIIRHNPSEYSKLVLINLIAGTHMFTSYDDHPLEWRYNQAEVDAIIPRFKAYAGVGDPELVSGVINDPELASLMAKAASDWQNVSLELKVDVARPLRAFFGLGGILSNNITRSPLSKPETQGGTLNWLFIIESVVVIFLAAWRLLWRRAMEHYLGVLLLLIVPTWGYLFMLCLLIPPVGLYMNATSSFVYLALLIGGWVMVASTAKQLWSLGHIQALQSRPVGRVP